MINRTEYTYLNDFIYYTSYTLEPTDFEVYLFDKATNTDLQKLTYVPTVSTLLYGAQYTIDFDKSQFIFSQDLLNKNIKIKYITKGKENPFAISSDLYNSLSRIYKKSLNNISSGLYLYQYEFDENYIWRLSHGSFTYNGNFYVTNELVINLKTLAPPTQSGYCKCYYFFINEEIISSYLNKQTNVLTKIGILYSYLHEKFSEAKQDVVNKYKTNYSTNSLNIAFMYVLVDTEDDSYDVWIEYDQEVRNII